MDIEIVEVRIPKAINSIEFNQGIKGDRGVSITDFTLDDDGNAVTTFDNGETKTSKLTSIASASASAKKAATSEANAKDSANKALTSETNAKTSETNAATYADNAKDSEEAAKFSEISAKNSEKSAKSSEEISSAKAEEASDSATSASNSATKAFESQVSSAKSAESAEDSYNKTVSIQNNFQVVLDAAKASETAAKVSETNAKTSETSSAGSANKAHTSEINAKTSETNAAASVSTATAQASNAGKSATAAKASATTAKNWAVSETSPDGDTDTDSGTGKTQSSRTWALESKASAQSASASASTATTQASSATASAKSASTSATSASDSATSAASSATAASNSASAAATSATNASNSESQASEYKTSASGSATAAASSASSASTSATNAKAAMNTANTAASSASTSATSASTSASNASKSEIAAKTAQTAAEKARDDANSAVSKLTGTMKYAGQVDNYADLESYTKNKGDVWNIVNADNAHGVKAGDNVVWNGTDWDNLSGYVDLSSFAQKADYQKVITSATANGATITFNHKDGTTSTTTVNNVASATAATNDAKGQKIDTTYEKITDASNVHTSLQNSINTKQDKLTFDTTPTAGSTNPVTSGGIKTALDTKLNKTGDTATGAIVAPSFQTGNDDNNYFQCRKFRGEGNASTYYHAIDFGYGGHNQVDFYEYGGIWNFWISRAGTKGGTLAGSIKQSGWNGNVVGNVTGNASTATKATQDASGNVITDTYAKKTEVTVKGVKVDGATSPLTPDSSGVVTIPKTDLSNYATKSSLSSYQTKLTFDSTPMANSSNPVTSDGIKKAIDAKTVDLSNYYTKTQVDTAITDANSASVNNIVATYARKDNASITNLTVTGQTSVPTANQGNSSNAIASTEFVAKSIAALVNGAPEQLNTLNELATALGNDSNFSATITAELGKKLDESEAADTYVTKELWQLSQTEIAAALLGFTNQLQRNKEYSVGDIAYTPSLPSWAYLECIMAGTTGDKEPDFSSVSSMGG